MHLLIDDAPFPAPDTADEEGLVAIGGDLSTKRLLEAYPKGIFPWYDEGPICWYSPDPRFVLFPSDIRISKSMKQVVNRKQFRFTVNKAFDQVINSCKTINREGQEGTWINDDMLKAYLKMHDLGYAHSAEAWLGNELVGGLYGIRLGKVFFGESMFSKQSNASKFAFIKYVQQLHKEGVELIDCQVYTDHLASLGAMFISRKDFLYLLQQLT
jgi:leucyl/phenylalanyl-tRNA---protein transferase